MTDRMLDANTQSKMQEMAQGGKALRLHLRAIRSLEI